MARILIVDDSVYMRHFMRVVLEAADHNIMEAADGVQALSQLAGDRPIDLLITDLEMPGMDGIQMLSEIFSTAQRPSRIIVCSARIPELSAAETETVSRCDAVLAKPFLPRELLGVVKTYFN